MLGVVVTSLPVRLIDVSRSGCLLESRRQLAPGTSGEIRVEFDGRMLIEALRVTRCRRIEGAGPLYRVGAEFVRTWPLDEWSLRRALYTTIAAHVNGGHLSETRLVPEA